MPSGRAFEDVRFGDLPNRRESQVAIGILFGRSRKQIADDLFLCIGTVDCYRLRLYKKLGATSAVDLVNILMRYPMTPQVHLLTTNLRDSTVEISVNGQRYLYHFLTNAEIDTVKYLFTISGLKALNYAKRHSESAVKVGSYAPSSPATT